MEPAGTIDPQLTEQVLARLGFTAEPEPTFEALSRLYAAWCRLVPFDNVQKVIHLRANDPGPLPGNTPTEFFTAWLDHGTGGTCWSGNGGLFGLLTALGYDATRGIATMLSAPSVPPNHGTVVVDFAEGRYMVDASILHGEPLRLDETSPRGIDHPAWGVRSRLENGKWHVRWRPLHNPSGIDCRIEELGVSGATFDDYYAGTRGWSPFNYELNVRLLRGDSVVGVAFGHRVTLRPDRDVEREPLTPERRLHLLVDELGMSEEIVHRLPADEPTPPPPWASAPGDTWLGQRQRGIGPTS